MEMEYVCDKCDVGMTIWDVGILASNEEFCDTTSEMVCLCKKCLVQREIELKKELTLIQTAITQNIK